VKDYSFVKQDAEYRPVASKQHLDDTTTELPMTTCLSAGWDVAVCPDGGICDRRKRLWLFASKNRSGNGLV
jgi:hypothetical protein